MTPDGVAEVSLARSFLFVPGNDARKVQNALGAEADVVVVDLEDSVPVEEKDSARRQGLDALRRETSSLVAVRINGVDTAFFADDVEAIEAVALDALVLPKAEPWALDHLRPGGAPVVATVETARGLQLAYQTAASPRVCALLLGAVDLGLELRLSPSRSGDELLYHRSKLVVDAVAARVPPVDRVWTAVDDLDGLETDTRRSWALGFRAKACIHPTHVEIIHRALRGDPAELEWAEKVVKAYERAVGEGRGAVAVDGEMIDAPAVDRARRLLKGANLVAE